MSKARWARRCKKCAAHFYKTCTTYPAPRTSVGCLRPKCISNCKILKGWSTWVICKCASTWRLSTECPASRSVCFVSTVSSLTVRKRFTPKLTPWKGKAVLSMGIVGQIYRKLISLMRFIATSKRFKLLLKKLIIRKFSRRPILSNLHSCRCRSWSSIRMVSLATKRSTRLCLRRLPSLSCLGSCLAILGTGCFSWFRPFVCCGRDTGRGPNHSSHIGTCL